MNRLNATLALGFALSLTSLAATPPPDQLLTSDTLAVITFPDYAKAETVTDQWPMSRLWHDPAMKPFTDKFMAKLKSDCIEPLEKEFGIRFADYAGLAQGQVTLAVTRNGWDATSKQDPAFVFLLDTKDKADALKTNLEALKRKWVDSGKQIKPETIHGVEFSTLMFSTDDLTRVLDRVFPDPNEGYETLKPAKPKKPGKKLEWLLGQSGSLLIVGNSAKDIEKILIRQSGGDVPSLHDQATFNQQYSRDLRQALLYGWVDLKTIFDTLMEQAAAKAGAGSSGNPATPRGDKILSALGLTSMTCLSWTVQDAGNGNLVTLFLGAPENSRKGLTKVLSFETKDSSPPSFVPADAVQFSRFRLDLQKVFATVESMLVEAVPQFAGVIKLVMDNAGKDKDPNFDLRQNLIGNLGDDIVSFQKPPSEMTFQALNSPPSLTLLSSPRADQLASALKTVVGLLPTKTMRIKERDFLGRKVYSMDFPPTPVPGSSRPVVRTLSYAASGGYVAFSMDEAMLEGYLRSSSDSGKSLRGTPGLASAAEQVGGMSTGLFGYENQKESMHTVVEVLKKDSDSLAGLLSLTPFAGRLGIEGDGSQLKEWLDFSLLPSFDRIAKYFGISVWSGSVKAEGLSFKVFTPTPPEMRK